MGGLVRRRPVLALAALGLVATVAIGGCSDSSDLTTSDSSSGGDGAAHAPAAEAPAGQPPAEAPARGGTAPGASDATGSSGSAAGQRVPQRAIIYSGSVQVRVEDVERAATEAVRLVTAAGGFVGGDRRSGRAETREADLELRVPAARFGTVVDQIAGLGDQLKRDVKTEDVTEESIDLDARIATQQARVASGRRLLAQAKSLGDLVMLEGELAKRESELASLEARKRRLADLTALSTLTVTLVGPDRPATVEKDEAELGFLAGLAGGWRAFVASLRVLLTVFGALLPWLVALGVPAAGLFWLLRRRRAASPGRPDVPGAAPRHPVRTTIPTQAGPPPRMGQAGQQVPPVRPGQPGPTVTGSPASGAPSAP